MKALFGCEYSGTMRDAFSLRGHECLSCDLLPTESPGPHYEGDVFDVIDFPWDFGGFHFPCTDSSVSGAKHFAAKKMDGRYYASNSLWLKGWKNSRHIGGGILSIRFRSYQRCLESPTKLFSLGCSVITKLKLPASGYGAMFRC